MLYQKFLQLFLYMRELIMKYFFGRIVMVNYCNTYYPINYFIPYLTSFILEYLNITYVYMVDDIYSCMDYNYDVKILPPMLSFKIDGISILDNIKNYKGNVPILFILYKNKILSPKEVNISYFMDGSIKNKKLTNIENYNSLQDIFYN